MNKNQVIEMNIDGATVFFEVEPDTSSTKLSTENKPQLLQDFSRILDTVKVIAQSTIKQIEQINIKPDEFELSFGVKISGEYGVVVSKVSGEGQISVKLKFANLKK